MEVRATYTRCLVCQRPELAKVIRDELTKAAADPDYARALSFPLVHGWIRDEYGFAGTSRAMEYHISNHEPALAARFAASRMGRVS